MARTQGRTQQNTEDQPQDETQEAEPSLSLFDASADDRIRVLRRDDKTQKWIPHGFLPPDSSEETIMKLFGGGRYWIHLVGQVEGKEQIKRHRKFELIGAYIPPRGVLPGIADDPAPAPSSLPSLAATSGVSLPGGGDDLMQVLKAGIINTLLEMMKSTKEINNKPATDPILVEFMKSQAQSQTQMMQLILAMATKETPAKNEDRDMLTLMAKMKDLLTPVTTPGGQSSNPIEMFSTMLDAFKTFREAADDVATPRSDTDGMMGSFARVAEVIYEQHQMQKQNNQTITHTAVAGPAGGVVHKPAVRPGPEQPAMPTIPLWQQILRQQGPRLVSSATAKQDPEVIAGMAIMFAPPHVLEALKTFFHRDEPDVIADILTELPQLSEHHEWLSSFVNSAQFRLFPEEFSEDEETNVDAEGTGTGE